MRLEINLATRPYEDARQFWMRWGTAVGVIALVTLVLLILDVTGWLNARRDRNSIAEKRALIAQRDQTRIHAEEFLNRPENRTTRDESQFLNQLIERKAFSWTRVLESLEKVMPPRLHVVSISPQLDEDNQLALRMIVAGDSPERAIELAKRMEDSHRFAQTLILRQSQIQSQTGDSEQVEIAAIYIPEPLSDSASGSVTAAKPPNESKPQTVKPRTTSPTSAPIKGSKH